MKTFKTKLGALILSLSMVAGGVGLGASAFAQQVDGPEAAPVKQAEGKRGMRGKHGRHGKRGPLTAEQREARLNKRMARLTEKLSLTPAQAPKVRQVLVDAQTERAALRKSLEGQGREARKAARPQMKALHQKTEAKLGAILTADQLATYQAMKAERGKRGKHGKHGMRGHGKRAGLQHMSRELNLSEAQQAQLKEVFTAQRAQRRTILQSANGDRAAARPQLKALRQDTQAKLQQILNAEQLQKLQQLREQRKQHRPHRGAAPDAQPA